MSKLLNAIKTRGFFGTLGYGLMWILRVTLWGVIHYGLWAYDRFFELYLYPYAILKLGVVYGTGILMVASFFTSWGLLALYDWVSVRWIRDALGYETLKDVWNAFERWLQKQWPFKHFTIKSGGVTFKTIAFFYFSLFFDPMTCLVMLRPKGEHGMGAREWTIFLLSVFISNATWGLMVWAGVETVLALISELQTRFPGLLEALGAHAEAVWQFILTLLKDRGWVS